jgi:outer membrane protein
LTGLRRQALSLPRDAALKPLPALLLALIAALGYPQAVRAQPAAAMAPLRIATNLDSLTEDRPAPMAAAAVAASVLTQPQQWLPDQTRCVNPVVDTPWQSLGLADAVELVLCQSPALRQSLAGVIEQRGALTVSETAFWPRVTANAELASDRIPVTNSAAAPTGLSLTGSIGLSWTLFDFGQRDAALNAARATLSAALSSQDGALLQSLSDVLRLYVDAASAWARLEATRETERIATQTRDIAAGRHAALVGSLLEKLQAQTAFSQAALERVRAQGAWDIARGALASAMGRPVTQPMALAPSRGLRGITSTDLNFASLRNDALAQHPKLNALRAEQTSLQARLDALKAQARGIVELSSNVGVTKNFTGGGGTDKALGASLSASIPLFNRTQQQGRELQIVAQISAKEAALLASEREIELELWRASQVAAGESENLRAARELQDNADTTYNIALGRYRSGFGAMLEMLSAQSALALANTSSAQAEISAIASRIRLSLAAGRMQLVQK